MEIAIYRYGDSFCLVSVGGTPTALVSRSAAMDLVEAVNAIVLNKTCSHPYLFCAEGRR